MKLPQKKKKVISNQFLLLMEDRIDKGMMECREQRTSLRDRAGLNRLWNYECSLKISFVQ